MKILLEFIRIIVIFVFFYGILGSLLYDLYSEIGINTDKYGWMGLIAILLLFFFYIGIDCSSAVGTRVKVEKNSLK